MATEIIQAFLEPFTHTNTFYGVLAALAFRKQMRNIVDFLLDRFQNRVEPSPSNDDESSPTDLRQQK